MSNKDKYVRCTTLEFERWRVHNPVIPYSLMVAASDFLPEAGSDAFSTQVYIPFCFDVRSISFQTTQEVLFPAKVKLNIVKHQSFEIFVTPKQPTIIQQMQKRFNQGDILTMVVENIDEEDSPHDLGDISSFVVHFHGYVM